MKSEPDDEPPEQTVGWQIDLRASCLAVLTSDGRIAGTGFMIGGKRVLTCAHVVSANPVPPKSVRVAFPHLDADPVDAEIDPGLWRGQQAEDVAFLTVQEPPVGVRALALGAAAGTQGHRMVSFGYPENAPRAGHYGYGTVGNEIRGDSGVPLVQLRDCFEITEGFSGGPVLDRHTGLVIGMVDSVISPDRLGRGTATVYVTPAETLRTINPQLQLSEICPYRGLDPFEFDHARWFCGRNDHVQALIANLQRERRVLALLGPSGSGKSSLVHAGLLPRIAEGALPGSDRWGWLSARPASNPYAQLADAGLSGIAPGGLHAAVVAWVNARPQLDRLVLVIDQFEELLVETPPDQRTEMLTDLTDLFDRAVPVTTVLVMRDDFYSRLAAAAPPLMRVLERALVNIPAVLSPSSLGAIVRQPAEAVGLTLEPRLTERIVNDAIEAVPAVSRAAAGAAITVLPLLEFALTELWRRRRDSQLSHDQYDVIGGTTGGLAAWCDRAYAALPEHQQALARQVLTSLVTPGDDAAAIPSVRRRRTRGELSISSVETAPTTDGDNGPSPSPGEEQESFDAVVAALADARIIITGRDPTTEEPTVELIHDALIREWGLLAQWLVDNREYRAWHARLEQDYTEWHASTGGATDGDPDLLLRGSALEQALERRQQQPLRHELVEFIQRSSKHQQRRLTRDRRRTQVLAALLVISLAVTVVAVVLNNRAREEARAAESAALAAESAALATASSSVQPRQPDLAHLLALESLRVAATPQAFLRLSDALAEPMHISRLLEGGFQGALGVAFSPDGQLLAGAGGDGTVRLWDPATGEALGDPVIGGEEFGLTDVAFSPDGRLLASASLDGTARLWDPATGQAVGNIPLGDEEFGLTDVAFSPDGQLLAGAGADGTVRLWDPATGQAVGDPLTGQPVGDPLTDDEEFEEFGLIDVSFSPDGKLLASAGADGTVRLWAPATGQPVGDPLTGHGGWVVGVAFSPNGQLLASASDDGTVRLWNPATGQAVGDPLTGGEELGLTDVAFSSDGKLLASAGLDGTVRLWDPATGQAVGDPLIGHEVAVMGVAFSPDGQLASVNDDGTVRLWDPATHQAVGDPLTSPEVSITALAFSPDGKLLASASLDGTVRLWDPATGQPAGHPLTDDEGFGLSGVAFSPDGQLLASASLDGTVRLWDPATGQPAGHPLTDDEGFGLSGVAFSPDGQLLATAGDDGTVRLWDPATGQPVGDPLTDDELTSVTDDAGIGVTDVMFRPDGQLLASANADGSVWLWDPATGQPVGEPLIGHEVAVTVVAFSPDGQLLASASDDGTVRLWDPATGQAVGDFLARQAVGDPLTGEGFGDTDVAFSPDGKLLASASYDGTVRLWDPATGQPVGDSLTDRTGFGDAEVAFSPDGQLLASTTDDRTVRLSATPKTWVVHACERAGRNLTQAEWERHTNEAQYVRHCEQYPAGVGADLDAPVARYPLLPDAYLDGFTSP